MMLNKNQNSPIKGILKRSSDPELIREAFEFAKDAYKDKFRASGENYIEHAVRVAVALEKMGVDPLTISFGVLHDAVDDMPDSARNIELKEIEKRFGRELKYLIERISTLSKIRYSLFLGIKDKKRFAQEKVENIRKMFLALSGDLRVILVELVSRLDGLNFLHSLPEDKQKLYAIETLHIFVPVARRLGLNELRRSLEDAAFLYLLPKKFKWLEGNIGAKYEEREKHLKKLIVQLKKILRKEKIKILDINYRTKSYWSTYQKLTRHNMDFDKVHDLLALRMIAGNVPSCYRILGVIHKYFQPISEEINDYIAKPKPNGYKSLHTTIFIGDGKVTEVQIRTDEMHKEAEYGVCAHWSYKEKVDLKKNKKDYEWLENTSNASDGPKINFFTNKTFVFTPKGDVIVLPKDSTPVDFAYAVHSDLGNHCESAKIGGKIVPLNHLLENGDIVEISVNRKKNPSKDWLSFVKTSLAKSNIRKFTGQDRATFKFPITEFIKRKFIEISGKVRARPKKQDKPHQIYLAGQKGMLIHVAKCCNPQPGDSVGAYLTRHRAAVLHRTLCSNFKKISEKFPDKILEASWE